MVVAIVILIVVGLIFLAAIIRVVWSLTRGVMRGDMQIEPSSWGRQYGRDKRDTPD